MKQLNIFGLRRVGNHAIIEWIGRHFNHTKHLNDCWHWPVPESSWVTKEYGDTTMPVDLLIQSYEDFEPSKEEIEHPDTIVLLRDWYNMAASRHVSRRGFGNTARYRHKATYNRSVSEVWIKYAELYQQYPEKFILFNKWAVDESYRKEVAERFNFPGTAEYLNQLPESRIGAGSSFKDKEVDPQKISLRYKQLKETDERAYKAITQNPIINSYCLQIFDINVEENND